MSAPVALISNKERSTSKFSIMKLSTALEAVCLTGIQSGSTATVGNTLSVEGEEVDRSSGGNAAAVCSTAEVSDTAGSNRAVRDLLKSVRTGGIRQSWQSLSKLTFSQPEPKPFTLSSLFCCHKSTTADDEYMEESQA